MSTLRDNLANVDFVNHCAVKGCTNKPAGKSKNGLCQMHKRRLALTGSVGPVGHLPHHTKGSAPALTVEQVAEVRRRMRAFEAPVSIARDLGVAPGTVKAAMKPSYKPAP